MKEVQVKCFEMWKTSISILWGKSPKVNMICGECFYPFARRFDFADFRNGYPRTVCPDCHTVNYVPIVMKSVK
jgi:hypothetical protein